MANLDVTKNFAKSTVSTGYNSSATEIVLVPWWGSVFPDPAVSWAFNLIWWDRSTFIDPVDDPNKEIVRCTAISWDTLTIIRAQEWTLATNKNTIWSWYDIALVLTKKTIDDIWTELDAKLEDITSESIWDLSNVDLTWVADWKVLRYNWTSEKFEVSDAWIWDMEASTYDPTEVEGDVFDMDNMAQGTTNKFVSDAELTVLQNTSGINTGDQEASDFDIKDLTDSSNLMTTWSGKQDPLTAGTDYEVPLTFSTGLTRTDNTITCDITQYADADAIAAIKWDADWKDTDWNTAYWWGDHSLAWYVTWTPWTLEWYLTWITGESIADLSDVDSISWATNWKILKWNTDKFVLADDENTTYTSSDFDIKDLTDSNDLRTTWSGKQDALGYTPEDVSNKRTSFQATPDDTAYPSEKLVKDSLDNKQNILAEGAFVDGDKTKLDNQSGINTGDEIVATGAEVNTGTDNEKMVTPKAIADSKLSYTDGTETLTNKTLEDAKFTTSINAQTGTTYTLVLTDSSKLVTLTNDGAITVTVPTNASVAFPIGTQIDLVQNGDGAVTFVGDTGVIINSKGGNKVIADKFVGVSLIKTDTNTWLLVGDLIA